jgi:uncharacterized membrane protein
MNERRIHQLFRFSVLIKGADAALETACGILLALVGTSAITSLVSKLAQMDLVEDPHDIIARYLLDWAHSFSIQTKHFYVFYLISHGVIKLFLVAGLLRDKLWAYPVSLVVLGLFVLYQLYRFSYTHGIGLIALSLFDVVVIVLIWHEYRLLRRHLPLT